MHLERTIFEVSHLLLTIVSYGKLAVLAWFFLGFFVFFGMVTSVSLYHIHRHTLLADCLQQVKAPALTLADYQRLPLEQYEFSLVDDDTYQQLDAKF
jgi:hypothetical protein